MGFLAVRTDSKNAVTMMKWFESIAANYLILQLLDLLVVELDKRAAAGADQVVVMCVLVIVLVEHPPVVKFKLAGEATIL